MLQTIRQIAENVRKEIGDQTKGRCLDAASKIEDQVYLLRLPCAIQFGAFNGQKHAWLDVWIERKSYIVDVTADQFGPYPSIILGTYDQWPQYGWEEYSATVV